MAQNKSDPVSNPLRAPVLAEVAPRAAAMAALVGEEALELALSLLLMILVERRYGHAGLGVFSYLLACLFFVRYVANAGISRYVEHEATLLADRPRQQQMVIGRGYLALMTTSLAASLLLLATAVFDTSHTRVEEKLAAYVLMAVLVPLANRNALNLAVLNARGQHTLTARLRLLRHLTTLAAVFLMTRIRIAPSFLLTAMLAAEIVLMRRLGRVNRLPGLMTLLAYRRRIGAILTRSWAYVLTDNGLDMLLNLDLFVLGLFVTASDLGVYAEVTVMARFFLVIPVGMKTVLRRHYTLLAGRQQMAALAALLRQRTLMLFVLHGLLALLFLLNFPSLLDLLFRLNGETAVALQIYGVLLPGLIYYSAFCAQEPVYEALGRLAATDPGHHGREPGFDFFSGAGHGCVGGRRRDRPHHAGALFTFWKRVGPGRLSGQSRVRVRRTLFLSGVQTFSCVRFKRPAQHLAGAVEPASAALPERIFQHPGSPDGISARCVPGTGRSVQVSSLRTSTGTGSAPGPVVGSMAPSSLTI
jgi:O-antigen/teichoic acid export membrane protein